MSSPASRMGGEAMRRLGGLLRRDERGSVLFVAVTAMLILGLLAMSFALLASVESAAGLADKAQVQAQVTAEAGLDWARDRLRGASAEGFTPWLDGTRAAHLLTPIEGQPLGSFAFGARIDNDCAAPATVPPDVQERGMCSNDVDRNRTAVLTAWATTGVGRARVRALVGLDSPWRHVCATSRNDPASRLCAGLAGGRGNPALSPADDRDVNGPREFETLPLPIVGCSRIDASVHGAAAYCSTAAPPRLYGRSGAGGYPAYPPIPSAGGPHLVVMGEDPARAAAARKCNVDPENAAIYYFGFFDCALSTPCEGAAGFGLCATTRKGCLDPADSRVRPGALHHDPTRYAAAPCGSALGMVFNSSAALPTALTGSLGGPESPYVVYLQHDPSAVGLEGAASARMGPARIYGAVVVEGTVEDDGQVEICAGGGAPNPTPPGPCSLGYSTASPPTTGYGYPLAILAYDPKLAGPEAQPPSPQVGVGTTLGAPGTVINGHVYSAGHARFGSTGVNGSTVAWTAEVQANETTHRYVPEYGDAGPPPGFLLGSADPVVLVSRTFIVCSNYSDDGLAATPCQ